MNYRHSFHAGNFADLVKHALVLDLTRELRPKWVMDTHAGAGLYDLSGDGARSKEAEAGVARLMSSNDRPDLMQALAQEVAALNPQGGVRYYPGSPRLIAQNLPEGAAYIGFELNPPVRQMLDEALKAFPAATAREGDGYELAVAEAAGCRAPLVLIDPPFERPDDYIRSAETVLAIRRRDPSATIAVWTPLKDLETFDGFIRRLDGKAGRTVVAEARLRPLTNPMKMNGCAMVVVNPAKGTEAAARTICEWVVSALGDPGGRAEVWTF